MNNQFNYNIVDKARKGQHVVLAHHHADVGHSPRGQPLSKLYRRKFALFPQGWVRKILVWQIRSPRQYHQAFYAKAGAIKLQSAM